MFCEQCKIEIPPAWKLVIIKNECPACGEKIMSDASKQLLDELKEAMSKMPNDPEGLAGWLLSNYKLVKIGDWVRKTKWSAFATVNGQSRRIVGQYYCNWSRYHKMNSNGLLKKDM